MGYLVRVGLWSFGITSAVRKVPRCSLPKQDGAEGVFRSIHVFCKCVKGNLHVWLRGFQKFSCIATNTINKGVWSCESIYIFIFILLRYTVEFEESLYMLCRYYWRGPIANCNILLSKGRVPLGYLVAQTLKFILGIGILADAIVCDVGKQKKRGI